MDVEPRLLRRLALLPVAVTGLLAASTGIAAAHVSVSSPSAAPGSYSVLTFRVPTESETASTVGLTVSLPTATPLASVSVQPVPGWTVSAPEAPLATPITTDDGQVTQAVQTVTWTADAGGGLAPGQFGQFNLSVGPLPDVDQLVFPAVQTYSDGSEVDWVEQTAAGSSAEPEHPAPTLVLRSAAGSATTDAHGDTATVAASNDTASGADGTSALGVTGVVLGGLGLVLGATALFVAVRRTRGATVTPSQ